jgi:hypothetical protein
MYEFDHLHWGGLHPQVRRESRWGLLGSPGDDDHNVKSPYKRYLRQEGHGVGRKANFLVLRKLVVL